MITVNHDGSLLCVDDEIAANLDLRQGQRIDIGTAIAISRASILAIRCAMDRDATIPHAYIPYKGTCNRCGRLENEAPHGVKERDDE